MKKTVLAAMLSVLLAALFVLVPLAESNEVSYGAEYSLVTPASSGYPDDGVKLTDGVYGTIPDGMSNYFSSGAYVGFNRSNVDENGNFVVIIDLGKSYGDLNRFTVGYLNETSAGISAPKSVTFSISDERNGVYTEVGTLTTREESDNTNTFAKTLELTSNLSGRYVKVTVTPDEYIENEETLLATWTFIDEIAVHSGIISDGAESSEDSEDESLGDTPQTGDMSFEVWGYVLLAVAAVAMALALFLRKRNSDLV